MIGELQTTIAASTLLPAECISEKTCSIPASSSEEWKPVAGFPGYDVSNLGRIRSTKRSKPIYLSPRIVGKGYYQVVVHRNGKRHTSYVAVLVATAFCPRPKHCTEVNHENGIKAHNHAGNLKWTTRSGNVKHAFATGLVKHWGNQYGRGLK